MQQTRCLRFRLGGNSSKIHTSEGRAGFERGSPDTLDNVFSLHENSTDLSLIKNSYQREWTVARILLRRGKPIVSPCYTTTSSDIDMISVVFLILTLPLVMQSCVSDMQRLILAYRGRMIVKDLPWCSQSMHVLCSFPQLPWQVSEPLGCKKKIVDSIS